MEEHTGEIGLPPENDLTCWYEDDPEFDPAWDLARDADGKVITITPEQGHAIERAFTVLRMVEEAEGGSCGVVYSKSRLLGRMLYQGLPPTKTKPPAYLGAPEWGLLPEGDPFVTDEMKAYWREVDDRSLAAGTLVLICPTCGMAGPMFHSRAERDEHVQAAHSGRTEQP